MSMCSFERFMFGRNCAHLNIYSFGRMEKWFVWTYHLKKLLILTFVHVKSGSFGHLEGPLYISRTVIVLFHSVICAVIINGHRNLSAVTSGYFTV